VSSASADRVILGQYSKFIVDPVTAKCDDQNTENSLNPEDVQHLQQFYYAQMTKDLADAGFQLVSDPGPGVARIRLAITHLKAATPALNILPQTKLTGIGLGVASSEAEIVDSVSGVQVAAAIDSEAGSRLAFSGLSNWGDAEAAITDWAKKITARIQADHGTPAQ
jgi:hypothetical protein